MKRVIIREVPAAMNQAGELVCIPRLDDPSSIGVIGGKGNGKTLMVAGLFERMYWYWGFLGMFLNDKNGESYSYAQPLNPNELFKMRLKVAHERPTALPVITLIPDSNYFESSHLNICRPYQEFLKNPDRFVKLDKSSKYIMAKADELGRLTRWEDIEAFLKKLSGRKEEMADRLIADFKWIYDHQIFDVSSNGVSKLKIFGKEMEVIQALMLKRMVPAIYTGLLSTRPFFQNYIAYILESIYQSQIGRDSIFFEKLLFIVLCIDELQSLCDINSPTLAESMINMCMAQGRMARIALIWATQNISLVNPVIAGNSNFIFAYAINDKKDLEIIKKNYGLPDELAKQIPLLNKFECIAMTREHFVVYNSKGERRETKEPMRCIALPPLSEHRTPLKNKPK